MYPYQCNIEKVCMDFHTNMIHGLTDHEAKQRLKKYGLNIFKEEKQVSPFFIFIQQFLSPLMYILLIATLASLFIGETNDAIVIAIAVALNVIIGFMQEWRAAKAALALKAYEVPTCQVKRNGKTFSIQTKNLVPGDIVILPAGAKVPADTRLFYGTDLTIEEAILTGESHPVRKQTDALQTESSLGDRTNMAYSGTYVISGKGEGIVVATGSHTELGHIARLIIETKEEATPLQQQIKRFSWFLGWLMLGITTGIFVLGLLKQFAVKKIVFISIALAVAAIPEGLLVAVTVVLAIGMQRMLKRQALVRHLIAAETLGSVSVICTDKTGTLTQGYMSVIRIVTQNNDFSLHDTYMPQEAYDLLQAAVLNNDAHIVPQKNVRIGNPTEIALLEAAYNAKIDIDAIQKKYPRLTEIPFSSDRKYMATIHHINNQQSLIVKGAPEKIFAMCTMDPETRQWFTKKADDLTTHGLRLLAFASKKTSSKTIESDLQGLTCLGLVGLQDPLRPHAADTIEELTNAGIRTIVVTGDHQDTAKNIARGAGIEIRDVGMLTGTQLDSMSDKELNDHISTIDLFARVEPKHKIRIIKSWQQQGASVAMIGDGVNDAPALKAADIGVALGSGSDVAHEISDMVLLNNNLSTISAAVQEGRVIFDNIRKMIVYLLSDSFSEILLIFSALLLGLPLPLFATQIFWINLISDGFPNLALTLEPGEPTIMYEIPRPKNEPVMNKHMKILIFATGIITDVAYLGLYLGLLHSNFDLPHIRTIIFTALAISSLFYVFSVRSMHSSLFRTNPFKNMWLNGAVFGSATLQLAVVYVPSLQKLFHTVSLGAIEWGIIVCISLIKVIGIELTKEFFLLKRKRTYTGNKI